MSSEVSPTAFKSDEEVQWCPGCGDYGTLNGLTKALANTGRNPENTFVAAGIGCSGKFGTYMGTHALHGVHGRAVPVATGVKLANPDLEVIAAGGDGDGYSIGTNHFIHGVRRNVDMTYLVMDNRIYGLTKGQTSPTSHEDFETGTTPEGPQQPAVNPLALALAAGGTFIAQSFSADAKRHVEIVEQALEHDGFSLVNTFSPCVTFNDVDTYDYYKDTVVDLGEDEDFDRTDYDQAKEKILDRDGEYVGVIYEDDSRDPYEVRQGVNEPKVDVGEKPPEVVNELLDEFY
ncbi:2-oxoacid:ferredoxin oxidoreductase subunit beta [Halanaeroarchaeum sulfurireducens]|uniref:2-oxoglutarate:ferredoxin oxidoreductase, beta subunit n=1 Tax=Halanaeroarchaeum sulfurireducens TaxID=1604004 RepID=A0A0F7PD41_9EURY|nr:2-oxoacid:ferredoxin oxidoreductase subunit beta [Halanaeroarchaeum sulfurireducens]AKH97243.1 2-oxoglutarate:ferredoxin oxidoreductase, beta subunit [Halanaeroarchaeum sulfurireducens]ALG81645.1 2-oxoglutarate:ferredoxin oxidoreductase, beta subunit [Halanaeroarchaeum sulfurireducens]